MNTNLNLKNIEMKAWKSYFADGMWDIFLGLMMLAMGVGVLTDESIPGYILMGLAVLVNPIGKRLITFPRIGRAKFGTIREKKRLKIMMIIAASLILGIMGFILGSIGLSPDEDIPKEIMGLGFGLLFLVIFTSIAYYMDFTRLYVYAVLFALSMAITEGVNTGSGSVMLISFGSIIILTGICFAIRFVNKYPRLAQEDMKPDA